MQLPNPTYQRNRYGQTALTPTLSMGKVLGAAADEAATTNPTSSFFDIMELNEARLGSMIMDQFSTDETYMPNEGEQLYTGPETPYVSLEEQERRLSDLGLTGHLELYDGETEAGLEMRIGWKQAELENQAAIANADDSLATSAAIFGVGLGVSFLDPMNIASGFIPVVGPAKYARMLQQAGGRLGRLGVRTRVGAAEGIVGAAAVEPIVLAGASAREADYGLYDSVANMVFGAAIGGGLHGLGGAILDTVQGRQFVTELDALPAEARGEVLSAGIAAVASGRKPIVMEPLVRSYFVGENGRTASVVSPRSNQEAVGTGIESEPAGITPQEGLSNLGSFDAASGANEHGRVALVPRTAPRLFDIGGDTPIKVPNRPHAELMQYALDIENNSVESFEARRDELFDLFDGFVESDPEMGHPFDAPGDVDKLALNYLETARETGDAGSVVSPDAHEKFFERLVQEDSGDTPIPYYEREEAVTAAARRAMDPNNRIFEPELNISVEEVESEKGRQLPRDDLDSLRAEADAAIQEVATMVAGTQERILPKSKPSSRSRQVANDVERQLKEAGRSDDQAKAEGQVHGAFAHVLEREYGVNPEDVYGGLEIEKGSSAAGGRGMNQPRRTFDANLDNWRQRIKDLRAERVPKGAGRTALLGRSQPVLRAAGLPDRALVMTDSKIRRVQREHPDLPPEVLDDLPSLIADPLVVLADNEPGAVMVVLDSTDADGKPIIAIVAEGTSGQEQPQLFVKSLYPLDDGVARITSRVRKGDALYARTRKVLDEFKGRAPATSESSHPNVTRPEQKARSLNRRTGKIVTRDDVFKEYGRLFRQGVEETPRGRISFGEGRTLIQLFDGADASTFLHESGHFFVETLQEIAERIDAPKRLVADMAVLRRFAGIGDGQRFTVEGHEKVARAFEAYMLEGRAPTEELSGVFARIRDWLVQVYRNIRDLDVVLTDEVRGVFDRVLASDDQLAKNPLPPEIRAELDAAEIAVGLAEARGRAMRQAAECVLGAI